MERLLKNGQTLIEILIAVAIVVLVLVAVVSRVVEAVSSANFARNQALATRFAQEGIEWARSQRDLLGWSGLAVYISGNQTYCVPNLSLSIKNITAGSCSPTGMIPGTIFLREVAFVYSAPGGGAMPFANVTATVSWQDRVGWHRSTQATRLSSWNSQL